MSQKPQPLEVFILALLLACLTGCSKKAETNTAEPAPSSSAPGKATATKATASPVPRPPARPSSPAEIAQMLKSTGNKEAAYTAIREYARRNPSSFADLSALLRGGDADLALLGAHGLSALATPEAATDLIAVIRATQPGLSKRQLTETLASFANPQLSAFFLGVLGAAPEREVLSAAQRALANAADSALLHEVVQRYEASNSAPERENLVAAMRHMQNPNCVEGLLDILNQQRVVSSTDPLGLAAADTLGIIGSQAAVSNLFAHLWSLREGSSSPVFDSIGRVMNPESLPLLASVAYGQVPSASLYSRMAAVQALGNYNAQQVQPALNWLVQNDQNAGIREAATNALKRVSGR